MIDNSIAPPQRLEVLWFKIVGDRYGRMFGVRGIPEHLGHKFVEIMHSEGRYEFQAAGSSLLPPKED